MGGRLGEKMGEGDLGDLHVLDLVSSAWAQITVHGESPSPRSYHQMCATPGKLHLFGGCAEHNRLADFYSFDIDSSTWTK
jgi:dynein heavy chain